jgi:hypothetical protein
MDHSYREVLGVPAGETSIGLGSAFRDLLTHFHPERLGPERTPHFREVNRAFTALAEPRAIRSAPQLDSIGPPLRGTAAPDLEIAIPRDLDGLDSRIEEILDWIARNFDDRAEMKSGHVEALQLELVLDAASSANGFTAAFGVPVLFPCAWCHGGGSVLAAACRQCQGRGLIEETQWLSVAVPGGVADRTWVQLPVEELGVANVRVAVQLRVT